MVQDLIFRDAVAADLPVLVHLLMDDIRGHERESLGPPLPEGYAKALAAIDADPNNQLIVAQKDGEVVACAQISYLPGLSSQGAWRAITEGVRVAASHRSQGIGEALFAHLEGLARARNCISMALTTNKIRKDAQRFYARIGFANSHEGFKLDL